MSPNTQARTKGNKHFPWSSRLCCPEGLQEALPYYNTTRTEDRQGKSSGAKMAVTIYLENASDQYVTLRKDLSNDFLKSANNYPMDLVAAQRPYC